MKDENPWKRFGSQQVAKFKTQTKVMEGKVYVQPLGQNDGQSSSKGVSIAEGMCSVTGLGGSVGCGGEELFFEKSFYK